MKNIYLLLITGLFSITAGAQCTQAIDNNGYTQYYSNIAAQANDQLKLDQAISFTAYNCVSTNQVKAVAMLFNSDAFRLDFCMLSYHNVVDKAEFYDVYDAFHSYSMVFRLHDFVLEQREFDAQNENNNNNNGNVQTELNDPAQMTFPAWNYPNYQGYTGQKGCEAPIPETDFKTLAEGVYMFHSDQEKMIAATVVAEQHCISMAHLMKLASLLTLETQRLDFMKENFDFVYDQGNYTFGNQCFNHVPYQEAWLAFGADYVEPDEPEIVCEVDEARFKQILEQIDNANFADDQLNVVRMVNKDNCFSTAQVKRIIAIFSFPENKLDAAEILYPKCTDRENYYTLKGSFSFPSYEADFQDMINGN